MAFGLFKKKTYADIIYKNGHIYTQDPEFPWAGSVACKDGKVMAVGDFDVMESEIIADDTVIYDLKERYMFPGFIDVHGTPVLKAFEDMYLQIDPVWDLDTVLEELAEYAENCEDIVFGYGFNEKILEDYKEEGEATALLDEIENEKPVVLLGTSGIGCWLNTVAYEIITATAEDEGVQYISTDYVLQTLSPFDFEEVETRVKQVGEELTDKGFTSVFDLSSPDYFSSIYRDCMISLVGESETPKQRFFGSFYVNRPINPELISHKLSSGRTSCVELAGLIHYDFLRLEVSSDENLAYFSQDELNKICLSASDKGFNIHIDATDSESAEKAVEAFALLRAKGYKKNTLVLASERDGKEDDDFLSTWPADLLNQSVFSHAGSSSDAVDNLTIRSAQLLGISKDFGSIEQGKVADFTVFEENPLEHELSYFSNMHADLIITDSQVVYDVDEAKDMEIYNLMTSMQL